MVDTARGEVCEFRGVWCGKWSLRPVGGGTEWTADPEGVEPATAEQCLRAEVALANARSRRRL
nr:hypothetical protein [Streptomyces sp. CB02460]